MTDLHPDWIVPDWPAPASVRAFVTTRAGGVSPAPFESMNLGLRSGDAADNVLRNRVRLRRRLPSDPVWLRQVHGALTLDAAGDHADEIEADAAWSAAPNVVCTVMVADCMPVMLCDRDGGAVAVAHAGWRGLAGGVIEATVRAMRTPPARLMAWLGPAIGPTCLRPSPRWMRRPPQHSCHTRAGPASGCAIWACWRGSDWRRWESRRFSAADFAPSTMLVFFRIAATRDEAGAWRR